MKPILEDPIARVKTLAENQNTRHIIALAGYPGSGKSTITGKWTIELQNKNINATCLGMDGFHLSKAELAKMPDPEKAFERRGAPYTFNLQSLIGKLNELRTSYRKHTTHWPGFEHQIGDPIENHHQIPPHCNIIIVEGIYTLMRHGKWKKLEPLFYEKWFLDTSEDESITRLCKRHQEAFGMTFRQARSRAENNDRLNCHFIKRSRSNADFLIKA